MKNKKNIQDLIDRLNKDPVWKKVVKYFDSKSITELKLSGIGKAADGGIDTKHNLYVKFESTEGENDWFEERWYKDGKLHRDNGPAEIYSEFDGDWETHAYYQNGKYHNETGSAYRTFEQGNIYDEYYYLNNKRLDNKSEWEEKIRKLSKKKIIDKNSEQRFSKNLEDTLKILRKDPVWKDEINKQENGSPDGEWTPSKIIDLKWNVSDNSIWMRFDNQDQAWCKDGKAHREDGPAYIFDDGEEIYFLDGKRLERSDWEQQIKLKHPHLIEQGQPTKKKITKRTSKKALLKQIEELRKDKIWKKIVENWEDRADDLFIELENYIKQLTKDGDNLYVKFSGKEGEEYYKNGKLHNDSGYAILFPWGVKEWYKDGKLHREDGPAVVTKDAVRYYLDNRNYAKKTWEKKVAELKNGPQTLKSKEVFELSKEKQELFDKLRQDKNWSYLLPSKVIDISQKNDAYVYFKYKNNNNEYVESWMMNGKYHRIDEPAFICDNGEKYWYQNNNLHRLDGPADERYNGYWVNGIYLLKDQFEIEQQKRKDLVKKHNYVVVDWIDVIDFKEDEKEKTLYINTTVRHAAHETNAKNGNSKRWFKNGVLHREDGPAVVWDNGSCHYWLNGKNLSQKEWAALIKQSKENQFEKELKKEFPLVVANWDEVKNITRQGDSVILECNDGVKEYWSKKYQNLHRMDGPAVIGADKIEEYYIQGKKYTKLAFDNKIKTINLQNIKNELKKNPVWKNSSHIFWSKIESITQNGDNVQITYKNSGEIFNLRNGELHCETGPALISGDYVEYWLNNIKYSKQEYDSILNNRDKKTSESFKDLILKEKIEKLKNNPHYKYFVLSEISDVDINGDQVHITFNDKSEGWYKDGFFHRLDGPAHIGPNVEEFYVNGNQVSNIKFAPDIIKILNRPEWKKVYWKWHLVTNIAFDENKNEIWIEYNDGTQYYLKNGTFHREDGPAILYPPSHNKRQYYLEGKEYSEQDYLNKQSKKVKSESSQVLDIMAAHQIKQVTKGAMSSALKKTKLDPLLNSSIGTEILHYMLGTAAYQKYPTPIIKEIKIESLSKLQNILIDSIKLGLTEVPEQVLETISVQKDITV